MVGIISGVMGSIVLKSLSFCLTGGKMLKLIGFFTTFAVTFACMFIALVISATMDKTAVLIIINDFIRPICGQLIT